MNTMYEVNWYYANDLFTRVTVTPITVTRRGVLPGCSRETITAIDVHGRKFAGDSTNYFDTESEAWRSVKNSLLETIESYEKEIKTMQDSIFTMHKFLCSMKEIE